MSACYYCAATSAELRPYGPGGALICFSCMKATPEREESAKANFGAQLAAAEAASPVGAAYIGTEAPNPVSRELADAIERSIEATP